MTDSDLDPQPPAAPGPARAAGWGPFLRETAIIVVVALLVAVLVRTFLVQAFYVPSASMEDTLMPSDRIVASKINVRISGVHRGDVIVFHDPGGWLPPAPQRTGLAAAVSTGLTWVGLLPSDTGEDLVKRVIAVGGDHLVCCNDAGQLVLNGVALDEAAYLKPGSVTDQVAFDVIVPQDALFMMGDNRGDSEDSRYHLPDGTWAVPLDEVQGKVVAVVWPLGRFSTVGTPTVFDDPKLDAQAPGTPAEGKVIVPDPVAGIRPEAQVDPGGGTGSEPGRS